MNCLVVIGHQQKTIRWQRRWWTGHNRASSFHPFPFSLSLSIIPVYPETRAEEALRHRSWQFSIREHIHTHRYAIWGLCCTVCRRKRTPVVKVECCTWIIHLPKLLFSGHTHTHIRIREYKYSVHGDGRRRCRPTRDKKLRHIFTTRWNSHSSVVYTVHAQLCQYTKYFTLNIYIYILHDVNMRVCVCK